MFIKHLTTLLVWIDFVKYSIFFSVKFNKIKDLLYNILSCNYTLFFYPALHILSLFPYSFFFFLVFQFLLSFSSISFFSAVLEVSLLFHPYATPGYFHLTFIILNMLYFLKLREKFLYTILCSKCGWGWFVSFLLSSPATANDIILMYS